MFGVETAKIDVEGVFDGLVKVEGLGAGEFAVETEGLASDVGESGEFGESFLGVSLEGGGDLVGGVDEVDEVGDGLEGVVNLVRDGGGEAAGGGEFFAFDQGSLGGLLGAVERGILKG